MYGTGVQKRDHLTQLNEVRKTWERGKNKAWMNMSLPDRQDKERDSRALGQCGPWNLASVYEKQNLKLHFILGVCVQSWLILCYPLDCSLPDSSVCGISQSRILEWVVISFSKDSSWPSNLTHISCVSCIGRQILYHWATWEAPFHLSSF